MEKQKEELLNYVYELIEIIKERNNRLMSEMKYKERREKAEELVAKIK